MQSYLCNLLQKMSLHQVHDDAVTVEVDRFRDWESSIIQRLHVSKLLCGRDPRKIDPKKIEIHEACEI